MTAPTTPPPGQPLNTAQAAAELKVSPARIRQFVMDGRLPARKVGRDLLFRMVDLDKLRDRRPGRPWPAKRRPAVRARRTHALRTAG